MNVFKFCTPILIVCLIFSCSIKNKDMAIGIWRGVIKLQGQELPFNFEVVENGEDKVKLILINASERLNVDDVVIKGDSLYINMPLFDSRIQAKINGNKLTGNFIKNYVKDYNLPFEATHGIEYRFKEGKGSPEFVAKKFKVQFADDADSIYTVGLFNQNGNKLTGTILTTTGDHRYLDGMVERDSLFLSAFDGEHAYLYKGKIYPDSSLTGKYWSGKGYNTSFKAIPNDTIELPDVNKITYLKPGYEKLTFSFPGLNGEHVSLHDSKYKNKVVIIQLLGSWCPNCMDETMFLAPWYKKNKSRGVEVIGLAYEKKDDFRYAKDRVQRMKDRLNVTYDLAIAGTSDKASASKSLPMLNSVLAFPTTIFIDKDGKVRKIHTGFSGPGTGIYYEKFVEEFNGTVDKLLAE